MKNKTNSSGAELESLDSDMFRPFDPADESWIVGGSKTVTTMLSYGPDGVVDHALDLDWVAAETPQQN